eukprot:2284937-Ditylum_brightwellii.AAC.1
MGCGANVVQQQGNLTEVLEHRANAALPDRAALTNLAEANLTLAKQLEKAHEEIEALKKKDTKKSQTILITSCWECILYIIVGTMATL